MSEILYIKNMVCPRCIESVTEIFSNLEIEVEKVVLGKVIIKKEIDNDKTNEIERLLNNKGFELLHEKSQRIIDEIKTEIIKMVHYESKLKTNENISDHLSVILGYEYSYLSKLFSSHEGITIEKYTVRQRIEKVKEFLSYGELNLTEISYKLGYSSVQHLSNQFKKITGLSPSQYKSQQIKNRKPLNKV